MKKTTKIVVIFSIFLLVGTGVTLGISSNRTIKEFMIVATNFPAYDFARAVAGDKAEIKMLVKPGAEAHDFEPSPSDIIDIQNSKLFIYTGGESDAWMEDIVNNADMDKVASFKMMDAVNALREELTDGMEEGHENDDGAKLEYDEHVWTSVKNAALIINGLKDRLIQISPNNKQAFEENASQYVLELAELDSKFQDIVDKGSLKTIVFGDRFPIRYFVNDYGLSYFAAFPGCAGQTEASNKTIAFLVDKVRSEGLPVVFKTEMSSGKIANEIASEAGAKVLTFNSLDSISVDDFDGGKTYVEIMRSNIEALREALK